MLDPKQILEYIKISSSVLAEMQEKVASLETEKAALVTKVTAGKKALAEKEASENRPHPIFTKEQVRPVMVKLAKAERIKDVEAATMRILEEPASILLALDKMASDMIVSMPRKIGASVSTDSTHSSDVRESDRQFETCFLSLSTKL